MRVISLNINGIRAGAKKGFFKWLATQNADIICLQEIRAQPQDLTDKKFYPEGYYCHYHAAQKKGYSGVAIYSKEKPQNIINTLGWPCPDTEGRYLQFDLQNISIVSLYLPSGSSGEQRQEIKFDFLKRYEHWLQEIISSGNQFIICGDWNIVHQKIDIKNFNSNQKSSGCLPEERKWLDDIFHKVGWVDAFRVINKEKDQYTWWSNRGRAYANNVGWRIDYQVITPNLAPKVKAVSIYKTTQFSDHAPLIIDYALTE